MRSPEQESAQGRDQAEWFGTTHWSLVLQAGEGESPHAESALARLDIFSRRPHPSLEGADNSALVPNSRNGYSPPPSGEGIRRGQDSVTPGLTVPASK